MTEVEIKHVFFWRSTSPFSQWYNATFKEGEIEFSSCEQYMMYHKAKLFNDDKIAEEILKSINPQKIKGLGRQVKNFDEAVWKCHREEIVYNGNLLKFSQHDDLKKALLYTGNNELVEASPYDKIWGIGYNEETALTVDKKLWGLNLLGIALMKVRDTLRK